MAKKILGILSYLLVWIHAQAQSTHTVWLDDLPIQTFSEGLRPVKARENYTGDTIRINGISYSRGLGAQSICVLAFYLNKNATRFTAEVGLDDKGNKDIPITFYVVGDKKLLFQSPEMKTGDAPVKIDIDLTGIKQLGLLALDKIGGINNKRTYCNWANAKVEMAVNTLPEHVPGFGEKYILTPEAKPTPQINSAKLMGVTPGYPFLYTIAASGNRPMIFSADNLPKGLQVSAQTGIITGSIKERGSYTVTLKAKNKSGESVQKLVIKVGDTIALTPPMGWNGWNAWEARLDKQKVIASADAMVKKGLINYGWSYINIDDSWQGIRSGPDTALQPNEKFPDMKELADHIHSLGLKAGIYSTPYISSYGTYVGASSNSPTGGESHNQAYMGIGKYRFETNDAKQMAQWGFDFLKYDWRIDVESTRRMSEALKKSGRDVVFSLSNNAPIEKAGDWMRLSNMFRTGPDIKDSWTSLYLNTFLLEKWNPYAGPGHWADPDMMILGDVSIGPELHPTRLSPDEQYTHMSIFSLLSSPLLIGCPIEQMDAFTVSLLTNNEVIAINQDPLGKPAKKVLDEKGIQVWLKEMEDGSYAVGIFNIDEWGARPDTYFNWGDEPARSCDLDFSKLGLQGKWNIRDVWRQKNIGVFSGSMKTSIRHHGVLLLKFNNGK
jgi:alpha-galactosidase